MVITRSGEQQEISQDSVYLNFKSESHEIDASTLGHVLLSLGTIAQIVNNHTNPDTTLEIKVKASKPGSFIAELGVLVGPVIPIVPLLLAPENIKSAGEIFKTVGELLVIKKELKGEDPEVLKQGERREGGKQVFKNDGQVCIYNAETMTIYMGHPEIPREAARIGATLESNKEITGFEIGDSEERTQFSFDRPAFSMLAADEPQIEEIGETRIVTHREALKIISISFEDDLMSRFVYMGIRIAAKITDVSFYERIDAGEESFRKGDVLEVDLCNSQTWDKAANAYIDGKQYHIPHVHKHIPRPRTVPFQFERSIDCGPDAE